MPGAHGISQHIQWDPQKMRMRRLSSDWFYREPFGYDLERSGLNVCAVDVPFTFPSRLHKGCEIMNWGSHDLMGPYACTPSTHLAIWRATGANGLPVFMEKPFLLADELPQVDPANPAWRNLIDFNRRFWPTYRSLAERVAEGALGAVHHARLTLHVDAGRWSTVSDHRAHPREGGALYDLGSQMLDLVHVIFGRQPAAILARRSGGGGLDERVEVTLRFAGGLVVDCDLAYGRRTIESVNIAGERGILQLRNPNVPAWVEKRPSPPGRLARLAVDSATLGYRGLVRSRSMLRYSVHAALESFFGTLGSTQAFEPGFADALRVARWASAAARSIAGGRAVDLE
jgi:predicted dehydrogenase